MPEDLAEMGWEEQQSAIKKRSLKLMGAGLLLVLVFSDPMVDVMNNMGARVGVPPFYVAFILAPLASNASEFIASYNYAAKKTKKTITVALAALEGAACMNNTFCLAIFMALVFFRASRGGARRATRVGPAGHGGARPTPPPRLLRRAPRLTTHPAPHRAPRSSRCRYTAETVGTLIIECLVAVFAMKKTQTLLDGALIFSLFPLSIAFIAGLEAFGFD